MDTTYILYLGRHTLETALLLAAPISMGLLRAPRLTMIVAWSVLIGIIVLVVSVRSLAQPWRGIVDAGVVVGLTLGWLSLLVWYIQAMKTGAGAFNSDVVRTSRGSSDSSLEPASDND